MVAVRAQRAQGPCVTSRRHVVGLFRGPEISPPNRFGPSADLRNRPWRVTREGCGPVGPIGPDPEARKACRLLWKKGRALPAAPSRS